MKPLVLDVYHGDRIDPDSGFHDIRRSGIVAVVHKATQGTGRRDPKMTERRARALKAGLKWGTYHFGVNSDGKAQALNYLDSLDGNLPGELLCLDFERYDRSQMARSQADEFVRTIVERTGRYPLLYSGYSFLKESKIPAASVLAKCPLWVARYNGTLGPVPRPWTDYALWQFTGDGVGPFPHTCPGCLDVVDLNAYNGTAEQLAARWPDLSRR